MGACCVALLRWACCIGLCCVVLYCGVGCCIGSRGGLGGGGGVEN